MAAVREDGVLSAAAPAPGGPDGPPQASVYVCVSCRRPRAEGETVGDPTMPHVEPGRGFATALAGALAAEPGIAVVPVECLAVCRRACTVAFVAPEKWTYIVGDVEGEAHVAEIATAARAYAASETGILRWADRPPAFKKGVVARVPPTAYRPERAPT